MLNTPFGNGRLSCCVRGDFSGASIIVNPKLIVGDTNCSVEISKLFAMTVDIKDRNDNMREKRAENMCMAVLLRNKMQFDQ